MALPAKPVRKAVRTGNDNLARPTSKNVPGASAYNRKTATKAQASKSTYIRKSSGISAPASSAGRSSSKGGSMSSKMKGVD